MHYSIARENNFLLHAQIIVRTLSTLYKKSTRTTSSMLLVLL
jgi:hypothetical protein